MSSVFWKRMKWSGIVIGVLAVAVLLHYHLPQTQVVQIIGTDVKRMDLVSQGKRGATTQSSGMSVVARDMRFINATGMNGRPLVFRNEDTGWGWPPYFKFNSADLAALAQTYATAQDQPWVLVTSYGWRIRIFNMFPNVLRLRQVVQDYQHFPWFNIIFLTLLAGGGLSCWFWLRRFLQRVRARFRGNKGGEVAVGDK